MKKLFLFLFIAFAFLNCARIDAGHVGIKVNLYGDNKGVSDITEVTGWVWYNPLTKKVFEIPTFVQNVVYDSDGKVNEEFRVTTKDGMVAAFDVSMNYYTPDENIVEIFKKYRKPVKELERGVIRTYLREGFNNIASHYSAEKLYENRAEFEDSAQTVADSILRKEGFVVEQIVILNEIRLPPEMVKRINDKVNAAQMTKQLQEEVRQAEARADKVVADARGSAQAIRLKAEAEAEAFRIKRQELTPELLEQMYIEKWEGSYGTGNVFGANPTLFKNIR